MLLLKPVDVGRNHCRAGFDPPVIGLDGRLGGGGLALQIVEKQNDIVMQCTLIALQSQRVVALLIHDLLRDGSLAVERVGGHDGTFKHQHLQQFRHCGDLV